MPRDDFFDTYWKVEAAKEVAREHARALRGSRASEIPSTTDLSLVHVAARYQGTFGLALMIFDIGLALAVFVCACTGAFVIANWLAGLWWAVGAVLVAAYATLLIVVQAMPR
jgi:hypothetical protein